LGMGRRWLTTISSMRSVSLLNGLSSTWQQHTSNTGGELGCTIGNRGCTSPACVSGSSNGSFR
jgi:hypothetical protein